MPHAAPSQSSLQSVQPSSDTARQAVLDLARQAPVRAQVVHGVPYPLRIPPNGDVFAQQLQCVGTLEVQICLQRKRPPVAEPVERRLVRGRHSFALSVVILQLGTGGSNGPCRAAKLQTVRCSSAATTSPLQRPSRQRSTPVFCTASARSATRDCAAIVKRDALCTRGVGRGTHRRPRDVEVCGGTSARCGLATVCMVCRRMLLHKRSETNAAKTSRCLKHAMQGH